MDWRQSIASRRFWKKTNDSTDSTQIVYSRICAGGGTAGHINPALAVAGEIRKKYPDAEICFVGTADRIEAKIVPAAGYPLKTIYLDNAATSFPKPEGVSTAMKDYIDRVGATINRSVYGSAQDAGLVTLQLRQRLNAQRRAAARAALQGKAGSRVR